MEPRPITGELVHFSGRHYIDIIKVSEEKKAKFENFMKEIFNDDKLFVNFKNAEIIKSNGYHIGFNDYELYDESLENNNKYFDFMSTLCKEIVSKEYGLAHINYNYAAANYFVGRVDFARRWLVDEQKQQNLHPELFDDFRKEKALDWVKALNVYKEMEKYTEKKYLQLCNESNTETM